MDNQVVRGGEAAPDNVTGSLGEKGYSIPLLRLDDLGTSLDELISELWLGSPDDVLAQAAKELVFYNNHEGEATPPSLVIHSATDSSSNYRVDSEYHHRTGRWIGINTAIEDRAGVLIGSDGFHVGRRLRHLGIPQTYNLSEGLLHMAVNHPERLGPIVNYLKRNPNAVVKVYALDVPMAAFLLWLADATDLVGALRVDANRPNLMFWNDKGNLHPELGVEEQSKVGSLWGSFPTTIGFTVTDHKSFDDTVDRLRLAGIILQNQGITTAYLRHTTSTDGGRAVGNITLGDINQLANALQSIYEEGARFVLEPHIPHRKVRIDYQYNNEQYRNNASVLPSAQFENGQVVGVTMQMVTPQGAWLGNIIVGQGNCESVGVSPQEYGSLWLATHHLAIQGLGLGGIDALVTDDQGLIKANGGSLSVTDLNIRFPGGLLVHKFREQLASRYEGANAEISAATRVIAPKLGVTKEGFKMGMGRALKELSEYEQAVVGECIAYPENGGWAMVGLGELWAGTMPNDAPLQLWAKVLTLEKLLVEKYCVAEYFDPSSVDHPIAEEEQ